jgi:hypothetical protein
MIDKITLYNNINNTRVKPHSSKYEEKKPKQNKTKTGKLAEI